MAIFYISGKDWNQTSKVKGKNGQQLSYSNHDSNIEYAEVERLAKAGVALMLQNSTSISGGGEKYKEFQTLLGEFKNSNDRSVYLTITKGIHQFTQMPHITVHVNKSTLHVWLSTAPSAVPGRYIYEAKSVSAAEAGPFVPCCSTIKTTMKKRVRGNSISVAGAETVILENERMRMLKEEQERANLESLSWLNALAELHEIRSK